MSVRFAMFLVGAVLLSAAGFCSPCWWMGFVPLGAALIWAAYDLEVEPDGATNAENSPRRR